MFVPTILSRFSWFSGHLVGAPCHALARFRPRCCKNQLNPVEHHMIHSISSTVSGYFWLWSTSINILFFGTVERWKPHVFNPKAGLSSEVASRSEACELEAQVGDIPSEIYLNKHTNMYTKVYIYKYMYHIYNINMLCIYIYIICYVYIYIICYVYCICKYIHIYIYMYMSMLRIYICYACVYIYI